VLFEGAPRFNEFVIQTKADPFKINDALLQKKIVGGFATMHKFYPELGNASLWCVTEMNTREQIDAVAQEVSK
jgi:glycine dehydrogenase subunit 1